MAWFEVDVSKKSVEVDLHDYSHMTAITAAREKIKEAYEHGFRYIKIIHGSAGIKNKNDGGSIKFALRTMLKQGELTKWIEEKNSRKHLIRDESIFLALRKNPDPVDTEWTEMPWEEY